MSAADPLAPLRPYVRNPLPATSAAWLVSVVGDHPSLYSRSPAMWNAAFAAFDLPAVYVPCDVVPEHLDGFLAACRAASALLGFNVTVPYKERVVSQLDGVDAAAAAIRAVNTVRRTPEGQLLGTNTDGAAALEVVRQIHQRPPAGDRSRPLLLLGAGGAARAVGMALAGGLPGAAILLCNRRPKRAEEVAGMIRRTGAEVSVVPPDELDRVLADAGILLNASSVGMAGPVSADEGVTWLEPFSPLAPADPPWVQPSQAARAQPPPEWWPRAWPAIARNLEGSLRGALRLSSAAAVLDLIYAPPETVLLKHVRWTGHTGVNGLDVLVEQAVEGFMRICAPLLQPSSDVRAKVAAVMRAAVR